MAFACPAIVAACASAGLVIVGCSLRSAITSWVARRASARTLALLVAVALGLVGSIIYGGTAMRLQSTQQDVLADKTRVLGELIVAACRHGEPQLLRRLSTFEPVRAGPC